MVDYISQSTESKRAVNRMLGLQLFCYRHRRRMSIQKVCEATGLTPQELDRIELGKGRGCPNWKLIDVCLKFYKRRIKIELVED